MPVKLSILWYCAFSGSFGVCFVYIVNTNIMSASDAHPLNDTKADFEVKNTLLLNLVDCLLILQIGKKIFYWGVEDT